MVRKLAHHGYAAVSPHLYSRDGLSPEEAGADAFRGLQEGRPVVGQPDDQAMGDIEASANWLKAQSTSNGRVGCIGFCSGGRLAYLAACRVPSLDAAVDCWGGAVTPGPRWPTNDAHPVVPIDLTPQMHCPLLGIFGNDDQFPTPARSRSDRRSAQERGQGVRVPPLRRRGARLLRHRSAQQPTGAGEGRLAESLRLLRQAPEGASRGRRRHISIRAAARPTGVPEGRSPEHCSNVGAVATRVQSTARCLKLSWLPAAVAASES